MISTLAMPVAPESPSSQHNAPAPTDECTQHPPLPGHQNSNSGNVLLSELAAAASAASRGVVLPPLRSIVENDTAVPHSPPQQQLYAVPRGESVAPQPVLQQAPPPPPPIQPPALVASDKTHMSLDDVNSKRFPDPPTIALSQAPSNSKVSRASHVPMHGGAVQGGGPSGPQTASHVAQSQTLNQQTGPSPVVGSMSEHLKVPSQASLHVANSTSPGLRLPSPSRSSVSSVGSHESAVSPVTPTAAAPVALSPHQLAPPAVNHHRVLAPTQSPLMPSPQGSMSQMGTPTMSTQTSSPHTVLHQSQLQSRVQHHHSHHSHQQEHHSHQQQHQQQQHYQPRIVSGAHNSATTVPPGIPTRSVPSSQNSPVRAPGAHQIVYVNPYGYPIEPVPYMYPAPPMSHPQYGYPPQHAGYPNTGYPNTGYGAPVPMMPMPPPQQPVVHPSLSSMPPPAASATGASRLSSSGTVGTGAMDMKPGMAVPPHMMQPWAHTFSQEIKRRTRTGCLTCRRRRVKCDEQHPQCRNCLKSERVCLGYDVIFSFDRAKRVDHLMHRRRMYRVSRDSRKRTSRDASMKSIKEEVQTTPSDTSNVSKNSKINSAGEESEEERTVLRSWSKVVELFLTRLAGPLDELLGSDMFVNIARRTVDYLNAADQRFVNVAGELEAMRQLLAVVYPSFGFEGLNILESQIALEKLRTTEDYCLLRGVAECLTSDESGASMQEMISPTAAVRRTIHQQHLQRIYSRLALLHRVLHPVRVDCYTSPHIESLEALNRAAHAVLTSGLDDQRAYFTDMLWKFLEDSMIRDSGATAAAPSNTPTDALMKLQKIPAVIQLAERNDARAVLSLLTMWVSRPSEDELHDLLNSLNLQDLPMALLEIGMASRA